MKIAYPDPIRPVAIPNLQILYGAFCVASFSWNSILYYFIVQLPRNYGEDKVIIFLFLIFFFFTFSLHSVWMSGSCPTKINEDSHRTQWKKLTWWRPCWCLLVACKLQLSRTGAITLWGFRIWINEIIVYLAHS